MIDKLLPQVAVERLDRSARQLEWKTSAKRLLEYGAAVSGSSLMLSYALFQGSGLLVPCTAVFCSLPLLAAYFIPVYLAGRRTREIEAYLTDALYQASSLSSFSSFEEVIKSISEAGYGALSQEFAKAYRAMRTGASIEDALKGISERNDSLLLGRTVRLLSQGYRTGADITKALWEVADDAAETAGMFRDRAAAMTVEKYTLLLAGGVIVPLILGMMIALVTSMDLGSLAEFGLGLSRQAKQAMLENTVAGNQAYLVIYALMTSAFVAHQENRMENALVYAAILLPASLVVFNAAMSGVLLP